MNNTRLEFAIIQRQRRGVMPSRTITAPHPCPAILTMLSESERLAQFELSRATKGGRLPNPPVRRERSLVPYMP